MPSTRVTPPLSGVYVVCALVLIGVCAVVGGVFGSAWAGAAVAVVLIAALWLAVRRADRRHGRR